MVKITGEEEVSGIGEASPLPDLTGETHPVITDAIERLFSPVLIGSDPFDLEMIHRKMDDMHKEHNASKAAIDMALYDLIGKTLDVPVYKLLGGPVRDKVDSPRRKAEHGRPDSCELVNELHRHTRDYQLEQRTPW